jgi:hypothetical protein
MITLMALSLKVSAQHHVFMVTDHQDVMETDFFIFISDKQILFDNGDDGFWEQDVARTQSVWLSPRSKTIITFYQLEESVIVVSHRKKGRALAVYQVFEEGDTYQLHSLAFKNKIDDNIEQYATMHSLELMEEKI